MSLADKLDERRITEVREVFNVFAKRGALAEADLAKALRSCNTSPTLSDIKVSLPSSTEPLRLVGKIRIM